MAQFARPDSDVTVGGWTPEPLFGEIDEVTPDDGMTAITAFLGDTACEIGLTDVTDPASSAGHTFRFRARAVGAAAGEKLNVDLVQGTTIIASLNQTITRDSWNTYSYTLSAAEADAITDYADLRLRFTPSGVTGSDLVSLTWAELEVPDVPAAVFAGPPTSDGFTI